MRTERILADLGYHARRAAQPRDRGGDIRRRAARIPDIRCRLTAWGKIDEHFTDTDHFHLHNASVDLLFSASIIV